MKSVFSSLLALFVPIASTFCHAADPVAIVEDGKPVATVVVPKDDDVEIMIAADELVDFIERSTGARLPVVKEDEAVEGNVILLGEQKRTLAMGIDQSKLPAEGFVIKTAPGVVAIVGDQTKPLNAKVNQKVFGTLWGTYRLLEDAVGCRFYFPGLGTIVPERDDLSIALNVEDAPRFPIRQIHPPRYSWDTTMGPRLGITEEYGREDFRIMSGQFRNNEAQKNYLRYRFFNAHGNVFPNHSTSHWGDLYHETHPEYFALREDGSRCIWPPNPAGRGYRRKHWHSYIDYSSKAALERMISDHISWYEGREPEKMKVWKGIHKTRCPNDFYIPLTPNDGLRLSTTPRAKELIARGTKEHYGRGSEYVGWFRSEFARAMHERYPHLEVWGCAYSSYTYPPTTIEFPPNYRTMLAVMPGVANLKRDDVMDKWVGVARRWHEVTGNPVHYWMYSCWPKVPDPYFSAPILQEWYRRVGEFSMGAFYNGPRQIKGVLAHDHLNHYFASRILWNPDIDLDAELRDYCRNMYGAASGEMYDFFKLIWRRWNDVKWNLPTDLKTPTVKAIYGEKGSYPPEVVARMEDYIEKALAREDLSEKARARVEWIRDDFSSWFQLAHQMHTGENPYFYAFRIDKAPTIDGKIDSDKAWADVPDIVMDRYMESGKPTKVKSFLKVAWDDEFLYIGANHMEPKPGELQIRHDHGGAVWADDAVDFFLDPGATRMDNHHLMVNAAGKTLFIETHEGNRNNDPQYTRMKLKTTVGEDRWTLEMRIPMSDLGVAPAAAHRWIWNFYRNRCVDSEGFIAVMPTFKSQTRYFIRFPYLLLVPRPAQAVSYDTDAKTRGETVHAWNREHGGEKMRGKMSVTVKDGYLHFDLPEDLVAKDRLNDYAKLTVYPAWESFEDDPVALTEKTAIDIRYRIPKGVTYRAMVVGGVSKKDGGGASIRKVVYQGTSDGEWRNILYNPVGVRTNTKRIGSYKPREGDKLTTAGLGIEVAPGTDLEGKVDYIIVGEKTALEFERN